MGRERLFRHLSPHVLPGGTHPRAYSSYSYGSQVLIFFLLELIHDFRCKLRALKALRWAPRATLLLAAGQSSEALGALGELRDEMLRRPWSLGVQVG